MRKLSLTLFILGALIVGGALFAQALGIGARREGWWAQVQIAAVGIVVLAVAVALSPTWRQRLAAANAAAVEARPFQCLMLAVWIGILWGMFELGHEQFRVHVLGHVLGHASGATRWDTAWLKAVSYACYLLVPGTILALLGTLRAGLVSVPVAICLFIAPGAWGQFLNHAWLDGGAVLVLSVGIAVQIARTRLVRSGRVLQTCRRTLPWLLALVLLGGIAPRVVRGIEERAALLDPPPPGAPNLLLVVLDTVRADHLKPYGYARDTMPVVSSLAERGVLFEWAISTSPWTLPGHATMFTGHYPYVTRADWVTPLDDTYPTLAEILTARGYATGGFVGNLGYCSRTSGLHRGFAHYEDFQANAMTALMSTALGRFIAALIVDNSVHTFTRNYAVTVSDAFLDWFDRGEPGRPFFAFLNYFDAHAVYLPPEHLENLFGPYLGLAHPGSDSREWRPRQIQGFIDAHDASMRSIDEHFGRVLARLDAAGVLDNTLVVVTGDHGEQFGENELMDHGNSLYRPLLHVPLVLHWPAKLRPQRIPDNVSMVDLPATLLDLLGVRGDPPIPGHSLAHYWDPARRDAAGSRSPVLSCVSRGIRRPKCEPVAKGPMWSLIHDDLHLILDGAGEEELYAFRDDRREEENLIQDESFDTVLDAMRTQLEATIQAAEALQAGSEK
jgi:arylsulfatase A-like enzyme